MISYLEFYTANYFTKEIIFESNLVRISYTERKIFRTYTSLIHDVINSYRI